jgi:hypothetical protein
MLPLICSPGTLPHGLPIRPIFDRSYGLRAPNLIADGESGDKMPTHSILGGKVKLYRRDDGGENWFCSTYFKGKNRRRTT